MQTHEALVKIMEAKYATLGLWNAPASNPAIPAFMASKAVGSPEVETGFQDFERYFRQTRDT